MEAFGFLITLILTVALVGPVMFALLYMWMNWYTNGNYEKPHDEQFKTVITIIVIGTLFFFIQNNLL